MDHHSAQSSAHAAAVPMKDRGQKMGYQHEFVICAYQDSPYLEECILSLRAQTLASGIRIATSTPGKSIQDLSDRYGLPLILHSKAIESAKGGASESTGSKDIEVGAGPAEFGKIGGIASDWNAALDASDADYITLVHQDDRYEPDYAEKILFALKEAAKRGETPLIAFTDYYEIRNGRREDSNENLGIKRILLRPLVSRQMRHMKWAKRFAICLGNSICCPSVTYVKAQLPENPFRGEMGSNIDWQLWEELSRQRGSFLYVPQQLMGHRIHEASTTSALIEDSRRSREDLYMLEKFWPKGMAAMIEHVYRKAQKSNQRD